MKELFVKFFDINGTFAAGHIFFENGYVCSVSMFSKLKGMSPSLVNEYLEGISHAMGGFHGYVIGYHMCNSEMELLKSARKSDLYCESWSEMDDETLKTHCAGAYEALGKAHTIFVDGYRDANDTKYSIEFLQLATVATIDGFKVKDRFGDSVEEAMKEKESVMIQVGSKLDIYCSKENSKLFERIVERLKGMKLETSNIKINIYGK